MSLWTNLLYTMLLIAFPLFCLGGGTSDPDASIIPAKSFKTCTDLLLGDAVQLSQDIHEICCNSPDISFRRDLPVFPLCHADLIVKRKDLQVKYNKRQKLRNNYNRATSFWSSLSRTFAKYTSASIMSGECKIPSLTTKLGYVYGNCSSLYHKNTSDICLGACGPLEFGRLYTPVICRVTKKVDTCQMASGEMRRVTTISCQCSA